MASDAQTVADSDDTSQNVLNCLNIVHFNDVYNVCDGRAARFASAIADFKKLDPPPLVLFSGDFLSPSKMSTVTKGAHMIPIMNQFGIDCGSLGNHDLDFGNLHAIEMLSQLNHPTLNSNIFTPSDSADADSEDSKDSETSEYEEEKSPSSEVKLEPLGGCKEELILEHHGFKIGLIAVAEDWCNTLPIQPTHGIVYKDFIAECRARVQRLRAEHSPDVVIVLTHSRRQNDQLLADSVDGIDLILGGHDHLYHVELCAKYKALLVKSGCDFKGISLIRCVPQSKTERNFPLADSLSKLNEHCLADSKRDLIGRKFTFSTFHYRLNDQITPCAAMTELVNELSADFLAEISKPIGAIHCDLDTRFERIRSRESASMNLICDIVRNAYSADVTLLCGGGIRSDTVHKKGAVTYADILDLAPFQDPIVVKRVSGATIIAALKHSILNLPKLDGRFAHVSGLRYVYDSREAPEDRLVSVDGIDAEKTYTIATRAYWMNGGDGFSMFKRSDDDDEDAMVVGHDNGLPISVLLRNFFWAVSTVNEAMSDARMQNNGAMQKLRRRLSLDGFVGESEGEKEMRIAPIVERRIVDLAAEDSDEAAEEDTAKENANANLSSEQQPKPKKPKLKSPEKCNALPSFRDLKQRPRTIESMTAFISSVCLDD